MSYDREESAVDSTDSLLFDNAESPMYQTSVTWHLSLLIINQLGPIAAADPNKGQSKIKPPRMDIIPAGD